MAAKKKVAKRASFGGRAPRTLESASIRITLPKSSPASSERRKEPSTFMHDAGVKVHHYSALGFLSAAILGFIFALRFASDGNWLMFLVSLALFIIGLDKLMFSLRRKKEVLGASGVPHIHHLSAHVFLIFALIGFVFAITFWLKGEWLMLLLSAVILILGIDNMAFAKRNHQDL